MDAYTDLPGVQFMQETLLPRRREKMEYLTETVRQLCLEMQYFPDSIHHPEFPQPVFEPDSIIMHLLFTNFDNEIKRRFGVFFCR